MAQAPDGSMQRRRVQSGGQKMQRPSPAAEEASPAPATPPPASPPVTPPPPKGTPQAVPSVAPPAPTAYDTATASPIAPAEQGGQTNMARGPPGKLLGSPTRPSGISGNMPFNPGRFAPQTLTSYRTARAPVQQDQVSQQSGQTSKNVQGLGPELDARLMSAPPGSLFWQQKKLPDGGLTDSGVRRKTPRTPQERADHMLNRNIPYEEFRVLGPTGEYLAVMEMEEALMLADENEADLILIMDETDDQEALVRIMSYSKFRLEENQKDKKLRKQEKASRQQLKILRLTPQTDMRDVKLKANKAAKFLSKGDMVRLEVKFKGRQQLFVEKGEEILQTVVDELQDIAVALEKPVVSGKQMTLTLGPKNQ